MRLISARAWALVVLSAGLQFAMFPIAGPVPPWRASICWFALVPLLLALVSSNRAGQLPRLPQAAALGYVCGVLWYLGNCYWIYQTMYLYGGLPKPVAFGILVLFALYLGIYHSVFACLFTLLRSALGVGHAIWLAPFAWVAVELARARITGFPWDLLGYAQVDNLLITRIAPIAGVMGISFVIAAFNAAIVSSIRKKGFTRTVSFAAAGVVLVLLHFAGAGDMHANQSPSSNLPFAVLMQDNLAVGAAGREVPSLTPAEELDQFSQSTLNPGVKLSNDQAVFALPDGHAPTVVVWPEAPSHFQSTDPAFRAKMAGLAHATSAPLIVGSLGVDFNPATPRGYLLYDSASLFDSAGDYQGRYDKIHLVPWGEYIPFKQFFAFAHKLTEGVGDMDRGHLRNVFVTGGHTYGVFVCYESIFGDEVREFANSGAEVLVNISDDGWYGDTGAPWQHLNMARMRAIENHRWILRSTNTGFTTSIDPQGRARTDAPRHLRAAFAFPFDFVQDLTLYSRFGDWFAWLCVLISMAALALAQLRPASPLRGLESTHAE